MTIKLSDSMLKCLYYLGLTQYVNLCGYNPMSPRSDFDKFVSQFNRDFADISSAHADNIYQFLKTDYDSRFRFKGFNISHLNHRARMVLGKGHGDYFTLPSASFRGLSNRDMVLESFSALSGTHYRLSALGWSYMPQAIKLMVPPDDTPTDEPPPPKSPFDSAPQPTQPAKYSIGQKVLSHYGYEEHIEMEVIHRWWDTTVGWCYLLQFSDKQGTYQPTRQEYDVRPLDAPQDDDDPQCRACKNPHKEEYLDQETGFCKHCLEDYHGELTREQESIRLGRELLYDGREKRI